MWLRAHWTGALGPRHGFLARSALVLPRQQWVKQLLAAVKRNRREEQREAVETSAAQGAWRLSSFSSRLFSGSSDREPGDGDAEAGG